MSAIYSVHIAGKPSYRRGDLEYTKQNVVAFEDRVVVEAHADDFFGGDDSKPYRSRVMVNPTWGRLFRVFKTQMRRTKDYHHAFLEGARVKYRQVDANGQSYAVVELLTGS